jgi:streptogramin lyase
VDLFALPCSEAHPEALRVDDDAIRISEAARSLGRKGGIAKAAKMTPAQRSEAMKAVAAKRKDVAAKKKRE